ncbi:amidase [uncultured Sneathiella sp.]|jgi:aspartyl-tRNA(Asn)/glutamyl-tRNA(Gln) amidotransferase subunit A|uniref:amidase n=1 Tax=uncultured Sneathiella sp. TaxID=879315 RepID=UPI0030DD85FE|tara:strand:+ start:1212 stop:2648 length:1437 start_codon:yes stop_codon:yes gene_type:complete
MSSDLHMTEELAFRSAHSLSSAFRSGELSPVDVTENLFSRIEQLEPVLNAFCVLDRDAALEAARASESRWKAGQPLSPIDGIPVSIKDIILTKGWPTLRGSLTISPDQPWNVDGPAVARLREAGAVIFGKTTTPEFASKPVTNSALTGITRNPWNPALTPGGSSGGAAAAVASGLGPLALATDAGGSIRIPASLCGVFGHKPSGGRVPMFPPTPYASLAGFGPITRNVTDAAMMLSVISGPDTRDFGALPYDPIAYEEMLEECDLSGLRIAYSPTMGYAEVDEELEAIVRRAVDKLAANGAHVDHVVKVMDSPLDSLERLKKGFADYAFRNLAPEDMAKVDPMIAEEIQASRGADLTTHFDAEMERAELHRQMAEFHKTYDILLTPAISAQAFPAEQDAPEGGGRYDWIPFTSPFNMTRQPAASIPCGFSVSGMPIGMQIVGPQFADLAVLQAARQFEKILPWEDIKPRYGKPGAAIS